ncbi:hypothetical protein OHV05_24685 [Kitasatospora sp. NBC_00070]|uniref:hypothetical protein n=1 Tax=Kitasatospora sp. NBC_00070 TaxID=2975962 RepID=UPI003253050E
MSNNPTEYAIKARPGVYICPPPHLVPGTPEAAIADWSPATQELADDRQARERIARIGGAR